MDMKREEKLLIVESDPTIAEAIEQAGERLQMTAHRASDGWEAIEMLETEEYDAIVINTDLPRHSGFGVLTYLREEVGDDLGNVLLMTSADDEQFRRKIPQERVRVLLKTSEVEEITNALRRDEA
jgi:DNA-binding response OmpR family regulator